MARWLFWPAAATDDKWVVSLDSSWLGSNTSASRQLLRQILNRVGITNKAYTLPSTDSRVFNALGSFAHPNGSWDSLRNDLGVTVIEAALTTSLDAPLWLPTLSSDNGSGGSGNQWTTSEIQAMNALGGFMVLEFGSNASNGDGWHGFNVNSLTAINSPYVNNLVDGLVSANGSFVVDLQFFNELTQSNDVVSAPAVTNLDSSANVPTKDVVATIENTGNPLVDGLTCIFAIPA